MKTPRQTKPWQEMTSREQGDLNRQWLAYQRRVIEQGSCIHTDDLPVVQSTLVSELTQRELQWAVTWRCAVCQTFTRR